jgi:hypothetical protein
MALPVNRTVANTANEHVADHNTLHGQYNDLLASGLSAADLVALNTLVAALGAWTAYTPTLTQSAAVTKTVTYAKYVRIGKTVCFSLYLDVTGTGTAANEVVVGLPVTAATSAGVHVGSGMIFDASAGIVYNGNAFLASATAVKLWPSADGTAAGLGSRAFTAALGNADQIRITGIYEAA